MSVSYSLILPLKTVVAFRMSETGECSLVSLMAKHHLLVRAIAALHVIRHYVRFSQLSELDQSYYSRASSLTVPGRFVRPLYHFGR